MGSVLEGRGVGMAVVPGMVVDPLAFLGGDVDECVEAEEGGTRVGVVGVGVEEGEEGGGGVVGWLGVVEEGVDGAGTRGRRRVAEKRGYVHAAGGHDGKEQRVDSHNSTTHVQRDIALDPYERPSKGRQRTHRTQVPSRPSPADQRSQGPRPAPSSRGGLVVVEMLLQAVGR